MSLEILIELAWKSAICAGITLLLLALLKRRSAGERSRVAHAGLLAVLMLPIAVFAVPNFEVEAPAQIAEFAQVRTETAAPSAAPAASTAPREAITEAAPPSAPLLTMETVEKLLIAIPAALLMMMTLLAVARLHLLRSRSRVLRDARWLTALAAMQDRFGFKHGTALLVSGELSSPVSWGVMRPVILLDEHAAADSRQAEAIIAHELAHVARFDWAKLILGRAATALFWFNPLVWILASRCHELREEAADDAVLRTDFKNTDYAELLVGVARHENRGLLLAANGVAPSRNSLSDRVARVLDSSHSRTPARLGWTLACAGGALLLNAPLAALTPVTVKQADGRTVVVVSGPARVHHQGPRDGQHRITVFPVTAEETRPSAATIERTSQRDIAARPPATGETFITAGGTRVYINSEPSQDLAPRLGAKPRGSGTLEAALVKAAELGDRRALDHLLDSGLSANAAVQGDGSPLIAAAREGHLQLVKHLLSRGAGIDQGVDGDGNPLIVAAAAGHIEVVRYLLDRGADIEAIVPSDENALMQAAYWGREDVVRLLIARGADVNSRDGSRTPLSMARLGGHGRIERMLSEAGARQ